MPGTSCNNVSGQVLITVTIHKNMPDRLQGGLKGF